MAGAMRKMGIYLGLVENDDARGYGRFDARQSDEAYDSGYDSSYDSGYDSGYDRRYDHGESYDAGHQQSYSTGHDDARYRYGDELPAAAEPVLANTLAPAVEGPGGPDLAGLRRGTSSRPLGLAPVPGGTAAVAVTRGAVAAQLRAPVVPAAAEPAPAPAPQPYRIHTLHPQTYNDARQIGESFRDGMPVIMNLSEMDDADAKRLVDFAAGLSFGLRGSIERVTARVFLISPQDVDVTAEDKAKIREGGFSVQA